AALNPNQIRTAFFTDNNLAINLQLSDGEAGVNTQIYYLEGKTAGLDPGFDIGTFDGVSFNLNVFTQLVEDYKGINFEVQSLPNENYAALIIPVGVKVAAGKEIIFSAEVLNLPSDIKIFLEDKATKKFTRLDETNSEYRVTLEKSLTGVGRFYLHTTSSVLATAAADVSNISIYSSNQKVYFSGLSADKTKVSILNVLGKKILEKSFEANGDHTIFLANIATGIYLVQLQTEKGRVTKKIIIE
ncbi:T9SS type A sorting domain-containing protein, partial [Polaribacter sp. IC063]|uniref:T9SS type A sorting domain-containing protein n=1 Tax=Polaribacter sp. IC063 TaxID=57031 RepID=UPI0011BFC1CB